VTPARVDRRTPSAIAATGKKTERKLVQLVYVSSAVPSLSSEALDAIAIESRTRNEAAGVTGLLLHQGGRFCGVLEGTERRVFGLMEKIITDRRHSGLRVLREEPIDHRRFENWSFGMLPPAEATAGTTGTPEDFILNLSQRL
jgi:hypothetical protein